MYVYICVCVCIIYIYTQPGPGRVCFPGKCLLTAQGQCFMHFGVSANLQLGGRDLFPKHKTLTHKTDSNMKP